MFSAVQIAYYNGTMVDWLHTKVSTFLFIYSCRLLIMVRAFVVTYCD